MGNFKMPTVIEVKDSVEEVSVLFVREHKFHVFQCICDKETRNLFAKSVVVCSALPTEL